MTAPDREAALQRLVGENAHLREQLAKAADKELALVIVWLNSKDARGYTEVGPLIAKALKEERHRRFAAEGGERGQ